MDQKKKNNGLYYPSHPSKITHQPKQAYLCAYCHKTFSNKASYECHKRSCKTKK